MQEITCTLCGYKAPYVKLCRGKVAARGRAASPTKRGRTFEKRQALVASLGVQVRRTPTVPLDQA
jgi:hypothetical protein